MGTLTIDGDFECYTLERPEVAIPTGTYKVTFYDSPSHGFTVPLLHDVPGRSSIEIHPGNWPKDSQGCILVGKVQGDGYLEQSRDAFNALMAKLAGHQEISITVQ